MIDSFERFKVHDYQKHLETLGQYGNELKGYTVQANNTRTTHADYCNLATAVADRGIPDRLFIRAYEVGSVAYLLLWEKGVRILIQESQVDYATDQGWYKVKCMQDGFHIFTNEVYMNGTGLICHAKVNRLIICPTSIDLSIFSHLSDNSVNIYLQD